MYVFILTIALNWKILNLKPVQLQSLQPDHCQDNWRWWCRQVCPCHQDSLDCPRQNGQHIHHQSGQWTHSLRCDIPWNSLYPIWGPLHVSGSIQQHCTHPKTSSWQLKNLKWIYHETDSTPSQDSNCGSHGKSKLDKISSIMVTTSNLVLQEWISSPRHPVVSR